MKTHGNGLPIRQMPAGSEKSIPPADRRDASCPLGSERGTRRSRCRCEEGGREGDRRELVDEQRPMPPSYYLWTLKPFLRRVSSGGRCIAICTASYECAPPINLFTNGFHTSSSPFKSAIAASWSSWAFWMDIIFSVVDCIVAFSDSTSFFSPVSCVCTTWDSLKQNLRSSMMAFLLLITAFISSWYLRKTHLSSPTLQTRRSPLCSAAASIPSLFSEEYTPNLFLTTTPQTHSSLSDPSSLGHRHSDFLA